MQTVPHTLLPVNKCLRQSSHKKKSCELNCDFSELGKVVNTCYEACHFIEVTYCMSTCLVAS
jgi:hypothetical protein